MTPLRREALVAALLVGGGTPAQGQAPPVYGAQVRVTSCGSVARLRGELIAVTVDTVWLWHDARLMGVPSNEVLRVQVKRRPIGAGGITLWGLIGGAASGLALTGACAAYEGGDCGAVFPAVLLTWGLWSGIWAAVSGSAYSSYSPERFQSDLRAFARFPQGLPSPFDPAWLRAPPPPDTGQAGRSR